MGLRLTLLKPKPLNPKPLTPKPQTPNPKRSMLLRPAAYAAFKEQAVRMSSAGAEAPLASEFCYTTCWGLVGNKDKDIYIYIYIHMV